MEASQRAQYFLGPLHKQMASQTETWKHRIAPLHGRGQARLSTGNRKQMQLKRKENKVVCASFKRRTLLKLLNPQKL